MGHDSNLSLTDRIQRTDLGRRAFLTNLLRFAGAAAVTAYSGKPARAERAEPLLSEFHDESSLVTGEKSGWVGKNIGLLAEAGTYSDYALARGIRTEGYNFIRTEAQSKYFLLRLNLTDFPGTKGVETREFYAAFRLQTEPFSGDIGVNRTEVPKFAGSDKRIDNTEYQATGILNLGKWFLEGIIIHDPEGPDIYRQGDVGIVTTGLDHRLGKWGEVTVGVSATHLNNYFGGLTGTAKEFFLAGKLNLEAGIYVNLGLKYGADLTGKEQGYGNLVIGWGNSHIDPKRTMPR